MTVLGQPTGIWVRVLLGALGLVLLLVASLGLRRLFTGRRKR